MKKILYCILGSLVFIFLILIYARFVGINGLNTNEISYKNQLIDSSFNGTKIVHLSDLHYKKIITEKRVKELVKEINRIKPDIVLITGDLVDNDYKLTSHDIKFLIKELSNIKSKYGIYSILGDNDYLKTDTVKNIYIQSNVTLLDNSYSVVYNENNSTIFIGGVSSYNYDEADIDKVMDYFKNNPDMFKIIMVHEGDYISKILDKYNRINMIVSGHSTGGSINIPGIRYLLLPKGGKKYYKKYYKVDNTDIFVSNGIGLNNINFRLFNHPSINFYRIYND